MRNLKQMTLSLSKKFSVLAVRAVLAACAAQSPTPTPIPTLPVAASGEILIPECPADAERCSTGR